MRNIRLCSDFLVVKMVRRGFYTILDNSEPLFFYKCANGFYRFIQVEFLSRREGIRVGGSLGIALNPLATCEENQARRTLDSRNGLSISVRVENFPDVMVAMVFKEVTTAAAAMVADHISALIEKEVPADRADAKAKMESNIGWLSAIKRSKIHPGNENWHIGDKLFDAIR
jgi:hypothetical protein